MLRRWLRRRVRGAGGEARGLAHDSLLLSIGTAATAGGLIAQVSLITHTLGVRAYGLFALVIAFVALVNRFVDLDVEKALITFGTSSAGPEARGGVVKFCYAVDALTGLVGFVVISILAVLVGDDLAGDRGRDLVVLYGLTLLASTVDTTSIGVLKLLGRFRTIAWYTILREALRVVAIGAALSISESVISVIIALVIHDAVVAMLGLRLATRALTGAGGGRLRDVRLSSTRGRRRAMLTLIFHTNLVTTGSVVQAQAPALLLGAFRGPTEVGIFKIGWSAAQVVGMFATPLTGAILPRLARLWNDGQRREIARLLKQITIVALPGLLAAGLVLVLLREPLLVGFAGSEARAASWVFCIALAAQVINSVLFWNSSLLYAAGRAAVVSRIYLLSVGMLLVLLLTLANPLGGEGAALGLLASTVVMNVGLTRVALRLVRRDPAEAAG